MNVKPNPTEALYEWFKRIQVPHTELGGFSICPYSKQVRNIELIETKLADIFPPDPNSVNKILVYLVEDSVTPEELDKACEELSDYRLIFLGDHKDRDTFINGVQTNNGHYNFVLCQPTGELNDARRRLVKTKYYTFWDKDYLKEIMGDDYGLLD